MDKIRSSPLRPWALTAGIGGFGILALYLGIIVVQGDVEWAPVAVVAAFMATGSAAALGGALLGSPRSARWLLMIAAAEFGVLGILALFSIGALLLAVSVFAMVAAARIDREIEHGGREPIA